MTYSKKCIPTYYKGAYFRSQLEARWAATLDEFGLRWIYEPEKTTLGSGTYKCDFWLPEPDVYIEIKPAYKFGEIERYKEIVELKQRPFLFVAGEPRMGSYHLRYFSVVESEFGSILQAQFGQLEDVRKQIWIAEEQISVALLPNAIPKRSPESMQVNTSFIAECMNRANLRFNK